MTKAQQCDRRTNGRTDQRTDGRTDRVTYRVACTRLKMHSLAPDTIIVIHQFTPTSLYTQQDQSQMLGRGIDGSSIPFLLEFHG